MRLVPAGDLHDPVVLERWRCDELARVIRAKRFRGGCLKLNCNKFLLLLHRQQIPERLQVQRRQVSESHPRGSFLDRAFELT
jgi:hypothetical protein